VTHCAGGEKEQKGWPMDERLDLISDYHSGGYIVAELARRYASFACRIKKQPSAS